MTYSTRLVWSISLARSRSFPLFFARVPRALVSRFLSRKVGEYGSVFGLSPFLLSLSLSLTRARARARAKLSIKLFFSHASYRIRVHSLAPIRVSEDRYRSDGNNAASRWRDATRWLFTGGLIASSRGPLGLLRALLRGLVRQRGKTVAEEKETGEGGIPLPRLFDPRALLVGHRFSPEPFRSPSPSPLYTSLPPVGPNCPLSEGI